MSVFALLPPACRHWRAPDNSPLLHMVGRASAGRLVDPAALAAVMQPEGGCTAVSIGPLIWRSAPRRRVYNVPMQEKGTPRRRRNGVAAAAGSGSPPNRLELVHEAARAHFSTRGYEAASMREIAADAGINIATLYFYCSTKEQLLFDLLINSQRQLAEGLREQIEAAGESWSSKLAAAIVVHIRVCAEKAFPTTINRVDMQRLTD